MKPRRVRAVVLAAGLGTRLRPLTDALPKPLLPVAGLPILGHTLRELGRAGCEAVAINLHHQGARIRERFGASFVGLPLIYSEEPTILGTLGALHPLRDFLAAADLILLVNGDSLCRWPLARMIEAHLRARPRGARATLLLSRRADPAAFGGGVGIDREGRVVSLRPGAVAPGRVAARRLVFAGAHVLEPTLVAQAVREIGPEPADIVRVLYEPMLAALPRSAPSPIAAVETDRLWHDLGTPRRYLEGVLDWVHRRRCGSWAHPESTVETGARIRRTVVEAGARVREGADLEGALVLAGAEVGAGSVVRDAIVGAGADVPAGSRVERRLVLRGRELPLDAPAAPGRGRAR